LVAVAKDCVEATVAIAPMPGVTDRASKAGAWTFALFTDLPGVCANAEPTLTSPMTPTATRWESLCIIIIPISFGEESTVKKAV
jgi:hypothetical protein